MASRLNPYINFGDRAREAGEFYASVFGGEPTFTTFGQSGHDGPDADKIMHGQLETPAGYLLMFSDAPEGMPRDTGSRIRCSISGDDADDLRGYFAQLSDGGTVTMPLEAQVWGDEFGMVTDKFGIEWMVNIATAGN